MQQLISEIKNLPDLPGIYQYYDGSGKLLYIGKAKSLKKRVKSYFSLGDELQPKANLSVRIKKMISETKELNYIVVDSEHDALILENSLIKQLHPKYNILLRDDKTYPYIYIDLSEDFPRFEITRKVLKGDKIKYFGPFSSSAKDILDSIYELFKLVQKKSCLKGKKLCLFYQIDRCLGPCEGKIDKESYQKIVNEAMNYLYDKKRLIKHLELKMYDYSDRLLFEEAAKIKNRIERIKNAQQISNIDLAKLKDYDIFAIDFNEKRASIVRLFLRDGKVVSSTHSLFNSENGFDLSELYKRALLDYYSNDLPFIREILLYEDFEQKEEIEALLTKKFQKRVSITVPKIGEKRSITKLAYKNAKEILRRDQNRDEALLDSLKELLHLENLPQTIEGYDNSHLQQEARVGAVIKWRGRFLKKEYRHYNLDSRDEYAQMNELIRRRVASFSKNPPPDLMVIDGGATLLKLAKKIIKESGANVDIVAIAKEKIDNKANRSKGRARDIIYYDNLSLKLDPSDKRLQFLQRIRDESHRFVIEFHRKQKLKRDKEISLLRQKGIGEARLKKLLQYFDTFSNIRSATFEELEKVVGTKIAKTIKNDNK